MVELPPVLPAPETGERSPGDGNFYQRQPKKPPLPAPDQPPPPQPPPLPLQRPDPLAPLVEELDRQRATAEPELADDESSAQRKATALAAYRDSALHSILIEPKPVPTSEPETVPGHLDKPA
ncbi:hypothetical protein LBMAG53_21120 [Planctomycetota bacterium]|nr:hypothetical protein LBMAG53_21120 [Planctomycetota bacterium]